jgi:hypothetical protein
LEEDKRPEQRFPAGHLAISLQQGTAEPVERVSFLLRVPYLSTELGGGPVVVGRRRITTKPEVDRANAEAGRRQQVWLGKLAAERQRPLVLAKRSGLVARIGERSGHAIQRFRLGSAVTDVTEDAQCGPVISQGLIMTPREPPDAADVAERDGLALAVADLQERRLGLLIADERVVVAACVLLQAAEVVERVGLALQIPELTVCAERELGPPERVLMSAEARSRHDAPAESVRLAVPVVEIPPDRQGLVMTGKRVRIGSRPGKDDPQGVQGGSLARPV